MNFNFRWRDDEEQERRLNSLGIPFVKTEIKLSQIDFTRSYNNGARVDSPYDNDLIETYRMAMLAGDVFPRILVYKDKSGGGYVIQGGNQRAGAAKKVVTTKRLDEEKATIGAYLLKTDDIMTLELLCRSDNARHGGRTSTNERLEQALHMVKNHNLSVKEAAKHFVLSKEQINKRIRVDVQQRAILEKGIDEAVGLSQKVLDALSRITMDTQSWEKLVRLVGTYRPTGDRVVQVANALKAASTKPESRKAIIEEFQKELEKETPSKRPRGEASPKKAVRDGLFLRLRSLSGYLRQGWRGGEFTSLVQLQVTTKEDVEAFKSHWKVISAIIRKLMK